MIHTETDKHKGNGALDDDGAQDRWVEPRTPLRPPMRSVAVWGPIAAVTVLAILVIIGVWHRIDQRHDQENFAQRTTQLEVNVATAQRDSKPKELILPGTFQAFNQTTIFPRSNGYVESWKVDIGDSVQAGQLLAEIATPEVDQQLAQARAQEEIAKLTADRWRDLLDKKVVSKLGARIRTKRPMRPRKQETAAARENSGFPANPRALCWKDRCSKYRCWHARDRRDRKFRHTAFQPRAE